MPPKPLSQNNQRMVTPSSISNLDVKGEGITRVLPRQISSGSTRGTQTVGYGNTKIDGSNNRITIAAPDGSIIGMGNIPGTTPTEYGFFTLNEDGNVIMKIVLSTFYVDNPEENLNVLQMGTLPDGSVGIAAANEGYSVEDGFEE